MEFIINIESSRSLYSTPRSDDLPSVRFGKAGHWKQYYGCQKTLGLRDLHFKGQSVTHRAPERMRESSYPTLAHEPPRKSKATPPSSPDIGTIGRQPSPGKLRPLTYIRHQVHPTYNTVYVAAVRPTGSCSQDI